MTSRLSSTAICTKKMSHLLPLMADENDDDVRAYDDDDYNDDDATLQSLFHLRRLQNFHHPVKFFSQLG